MSSWVPDLDFSLSEFEQAGLYTAEEHRDEAQSRPAVIAITENKRGGSLQEYCAPEPAADSVGHLQHVSMHLQADQAGPTQGASGSSQLWRPITPDAQKHHQPQQGRVEQTAEGATNISHKARLNREHQRTFQRRRKVLHVHICRLFLATEHQKVYLVAS